MNKTTALKFLAQHQPMPSDEHITKELLDDYRAALEVCLQNPTSECIRLLLNSFGEIDLFGNYSRVSEVLEKARRDDVVPVIREALGSRFRSVRYWNAQMAATFPDVSLIDPLARLLQEQDVDVRSAAVFALSRIKETRVLKILTEALDLEREQDIRELIDESVAELSGLARD